MLTQIDDKKNSLGLPKDDFVKFVNSSFLDRIHDSYRVFLGGQHNTGNVLGIIDCLGFFIPRILLDLLSEFNDYLKMKLHWLVNWPLQMLISVLRIPLLILHILTINIFIRTVTAMLLTLAIALPIILLIHPVIFIIKQYYTSDTNIARLSAKECISESNLENTSNQTKNGCEIIKDYRFKSESEERCIKVTHNTQRNGGHMVSTFKFSLFSEKNTLSRESKDYNKDELYNSSLARALSCVK